MLRIVSSATGLFMGGIHQIFAILFVNINIKKWRQKKMKKIETINFVSREDRQGSMPKLSKEEVRSDKEFNDLKIKIVIEHCDEILKMLSRKRYFDYRKDENDEPTYNPTEMLVIKVMTEVLSIHKKDGYLNEIYLDNNKREMRQESFPIFIRTALELFPEIVFPVTWFGNFDKKRWGDVQTFVIASILAKTFELEEIIKGFFDNEYYNDMGVLLNWYINVKKVSRSRAFSIVGGEIGKSTSYVRDHYTG